MRKILLSLLLAAVTSGLALADDISAGAARIILPGWISAARCGQIIAMKTGKAVIIATRRICVLILSVSTAAAFMIIISLMPGSGSRITVNTPSTALT